MPFTVGKCVRNPRFDAGTGAIIYPSIADYRTDRCGLKEPRFFKAKEESLHDTGTRQILRARLRRVVG